MDFIQFFRKAFWDDTFNNVMNILIFASYLYVSLHVYSFFIIGALGKDINNEWLYFQGHNVIELMLSFAISLIIKEVLDRLIMKFGKLISNNIWSLDKVQIRSVFIKVQFIQELKKDWQEGLKVSLYFANAASVIVFFIYCISSVFVGVYLFFCWLPLLIFILSILHSIIYYFEINEFGTNTQ